MGVGTGGWGFESVGICRCWSEVGWIVGDSLPCSQREAVLAGVVFVAASATKTGASCNRVIAMAVGDKGGRKSRCRDSRWHY